MINGMASLGTDIGGQSILSAIIEDGRIIASERRPTGDDMDALMDSICQAVEATIAAAGMDKDAIEGAGMGVPAFRDRASGRYRFPNIRGGNDVDIGAMAAERLGFDIIIGNDADFTALGMMGRTASFEVLKQGGGSDALTKLVVITIGTGIGGGAVIRAAGKDLMLSGKDGLTEIGHMKIIEDGGRVCGCGKRGCVEAYASTSSISAIYEEGSGMAKSAEEIDRLAFDGDPHARSVMADAGAALGICLANVLNMLNPEYIVFTGGGANSPADGAFFASCLDAIEDRSLPEAYDAASLLILPDAKEHGVLGAARAGMGEGF